MDPLDSAEHSWESWAFWIVRSRGFVRTSCSSIVVSVRLQRNVAKILEKRKCFSYTVGQGLLPVWFITNMKVKFIFFLRLLRSIYGNMSSSACSVKLDYHYNSDTLSGT